MAISVTASFRPNSSPSSSGSYSSQTSVMYSPFSIHHPSQILIFFFTKFQAYLANTQANQCLRHFDEFGQRSLPIRILWVGKKRSQGVQFVFNEYIEKLKLYCTVDDVQIRSNPKNARDRKVQVEDEDNAVMNLIRSSDWVVLLDERGQDIGSEQMADLLGDAGNTGAAGLSFCIGGPYGHGRKLRERANLCIKLSSLVFNHQIALLVLVEQLYRYDLDGVDYYGMDNQDIEEATIQRMEAGDQVAIILDPRVKLAGLGNVLSHIGVQLDIDYTLQVVDTHEKLFEIYAIYENKFGNLTTQQTQQDQPAR
ncbi:Putative RNA methyltransferase [Morus notabilis]|uniref:Putative RNA methyltransferase n=1 Tax=Morus notabilis TaxID=981085 RepID=W9RUX1_9ROSA|nr:Putative RNA methyltransferase [Morus notabilis]